MPDENPDSPVARRWLLGSFAFFALLMLVVFLVLSLMPDRRSPGEGENDDGIVETYNPALDNEVPAEAGALLLTEYRFDPGARVIEGSVMNNASSPYVNVQVSFELLRADSSVAGTVRDTTRQLEPGESWIFRIALTDADGVSAVRPGRLTAGQRDMPDRRSNAEQMQQGMGDERNTIADDRRNGR